MELCRSWKRWRDLEDEIEEEELRWWMGGLNIECTSR